MLLDEWQRGGMPSTERAHVCYDATNDRSACSCTPVIYRQAGPAHSERKRRALHVYVTGPQLAS
jgi:hypothetical protein